MKLLRYGMPGQEKPGILLKGQAYALPGFNEDYNESFFADGGLQRLESFLKCASAGLPPIPDHVRIGSPIARPSKIVAVGLNYMEHILATGLPVPAEPVVFLKSTSSFCGAYDDLIIPFQSEKTDWETELAVIIGKKASYISESNAMNYVAGYALMNDVSERAYQIERNGTVDKGKGCDTFCPVGPCMVTIDEINDVNNLSIWLTVNNKPMQQGNTGDLYFKIPYLVSYISQFMTLLPGDIIATGTPSGTGHRQLPPVFLKSGDVLQYGIEHLGEAKQFCRDVEIDQA